jgi:hypothetical protein
VTGTSGSGDERSADLELRFRILSTEYSTLIFSLGSTWSVSAARTNLFFVALSTAGVGLALIADASHFSREFQVFALAVLLLILEGGACVGRGRVRGRLDIGVGVALPAAAPHPAEARGALSVRAPAIETGRSSPHPVRTNR